MFNVKFAMLSVIEMKSQQLFYTISDNYAGVSSSPLSFCQNAYLDIFMSYSGPHSSAKIDFILNLQNCVTLRKHTFLQHSTCGAQGLPRPDLRRLVTSNLNPCQVGAWRAPEISGENYRDYQTFFRAVRPFHGQGCILVLMMVNTLVKKYWF